jgi:hypothetical protein
LLFFSLNHLTDGIFTLNISMLLILSFNIIPLFINWLTTAYSWPIITTCESVLVIFISFTNPKVVAVVGAVLDTIINLIFLPSTVTLVVIILHSKVSSAFQY